MNTVDTEAENTIKEKPCIAVLMSTYNGEKYIREQLDSIINQKGVNIRLIVRDDGSTDSTVDILKEYAEKYPIKIVLDGENVGPGESFMRLVYKYADEPKIDYYAFADQDDIWIEDKLRVAVEKIQEMQSDKPILYSSNQYLYIDGVNKGLRHKEPQSIELIPHMTKNTIAGCTFVFNKALAKLVADADRPEPKIIKYRLHDAWMILVAICCGKVINDEKSHMLYRIHEGNTVGVKDFSTKEMIKRTCDLLRHEGNSNIRMLTAQELLRLFPMIGNDKKEVLHLFADYQKEWKTKNTLAFDKEISANCGESPVVFAIKVLMNLV